VKQASAARARALAPVEAPLTWAFDGRFPASLADLEDTLRRAIVQVGDVARVLVVIELSLPALKARLAAGDKVQPAWGEFLARVASSYGLPAAPRLRYLTREGPLLVMIIAYRS
jgi:hypothetical protein